MKLDKHVFVCINERKADDPRGCCKSRGSEAIVEAMKEAIAQKGLQGKIRINKAGCLDQCRKGVSMVIYPEGVWYGHVTLEDIPEVVESHFLANKPVARLRTNLK